MSKHKTDPSKLPALGRMFGWVDRPGSADKIFWALIVVCILLFLADFTYHKHAYFSWEEMPGFYAIYGFVLFTALILVAKGLRVLIKRPEDFYKDKAIDREQYPEEELGKVNYDD